MARFHSHLWRSTAAFLIVVANLVPLAPAQAAPDNAWSAPA